MPSARACVGAECEGPQNERAPGQALAVAWLGARNPLIPKAVRKGQQCDGGNPDDAASLVGWTQKTPMPDGLRTR